MAFFELPVLSTAFYGLIIALLFAYYLRYAWRILKDDGMGPITFASSSSSGSSPALEPGDSYPGMVNLSGTLCYMNSVLQAWASLPHLHQHLERIIQLATAADVPTPVTDAVHDVLSQLNTGHAKSPAPLRPHALLVALSPLPAIRRLLATREQQDAHELFVVLAEAVSDEATKVANEVARTRGLGQVLDLASLDVAALKKGGSVRRQPIVRPEQSLQAPWDGLLARRRICRRCGYSDVVRMDSLGGMELPVPRSGDTTLDACITEYLSPERLDGVTCEMCTLRATADAYEARAAAEERLAAMLPSNPSPAGAEPKKKKKKKKPHAGSSSAANGTAASAEKANGLPAGVAEMAELSSDSRAATLAMAQRLRAMVSAGVPALEAGAKWETVRTESIRATAVVRAPRTLRFHFVRSEYTPYGQLLKKTARVSFPLFFDLAPHMSSGVEPTQNGSGINVQAALANGGVTPQRVLYRLESAILHYGYTHSSGHFVAIRRKPGAVPGVPGKGWLRISDADVEEVGAEELVASQGLVFMLIYEKVELPPSRTEDLKEKIEFPAAVPPQPVEAPRDAQSVLAAIPSTVPAGTSVDDLD